jgi:branched-chain amino acid aminotransferase
MGKKADLDWKNLPFGVIETDYNIRYYFKDGKWSEGEMVKDTDLTIHIASPCIHYGQQAFEGMKAFETAGGDIVVFRADENGKRLQESCRRIFIPEMPMDLFLDGIKKVVSANSRFVPPYGTGASLYIRPVVIGTGGQVGLGPASEYIFIIMVTPVGPYYKGGFKPVKALVVEEYDRAAPLGVGDCKVGGNYAAGLMARQFGLDRGYPIALFLDPREKKYIDEFSTSNFMGIKENKYILPDSKTILPSITNKSLAVIAEDIGMTVEKRPVEIEEIEEFDEIGAVGTAAVITPISVIHYRGKDFTYGDGESAGPVITDLYNRLVAIQTGDDPDRHSWLIKVD